MIRRKFLTTGAIMGLGSGSFIKALAGPKAYNAGKKSITARIGICTDLHQDIIYDAPRRIQAFIDEMIVLKPDFIIQLGDFCTPKMENKIIMDIWNKFEGPKYHVIGNHDTDCGFTHDDVVNFWGAKDKYYSFNQHGYHFIVLNGNEKGNGYAGYARTISETQRNWLEKDIADTNLPVIVFCHQPLDNDIGGIDQANWVRTIFDRANQTAGHTKVKLVISGHHHLDWCNVYNGVHYLQINSMSYQWMGDSFQHAHYSNDIESAHPSIKYTAPYKDPIWAMLTIYSDGTIEVKGKKTEFLSPSPKDLQSPKYHLGYTDVPYISDRVLRV